MNDHFLSLSDLILIPEFAKAFGSNNKEIIKKKLFENGMDISQDIEEVVCNHRNLQGNVVNCLRFEGTERMDKAWLSSGSASWNAVLESCDKELRIELKVMGKESNHTGALMDEMQRYKKSK